MKSKDYKIGDLIETRSNDKDKHHWIVVEAQTSSPTRMFKRHKRIGRGMPKRQKRHAMKQKSLTFIRLRSCFCLKGTTVHQLMPSDCDLRNQLFVTGEKSWLDEQLCNGWKNKSGGE